MKKTIVTGLSLVTLIFLGSLIAPKISADSTTEPNNTSCRYNQDCTRNEEWKESFETRREDCRDRLSNDLDKSVSNGNITREDANKRLENFDSHTKNRLEHKGQGHHGSGQGNRGNGQRHNNHKNNKGNCQ